MWKLLIKEPSCAEKNWQQYFQKYTAFSEKNDWLTDRHSHMTAPPKSSKQFRIENLDSDYSQASGMRSTNKQVNCCFSNQKFDTNETLNTWIINLLNHAGKHQYYINWAYIGAKDWVLIAPGSELQK